MIEQLKSDILKAFGEDLVYTKDCKFLADTICNVTGTRISTTTIRRLYGFLKATTHPAKYTLNILAQYLKFDSWEDYCDYHTSSLEKKLEPKDYWKAFRKKSLNLSKETYQLISGQSGISFPAVVAIKDAENRMEEFLESSKIAMSFVAPGGYGKSSMLAKWFEKNWIRNQREDVVVFLSAINMISFLRKDFKLDQWLKDQIKFSKEKSFQYFLEHPEECESRIIIVIDALDEITYDDFKLERLFLQLKQFILKYQESDKIKLVITSRNTTWERFALPIVLKGSQLADCWYDLGRNVDKINHTNLKSLTNHEIQYVINRTINQEYSICLKVADLSQTQREVISNPFFLELFVKLFDPNKEYANGEGHELLKEYLKNKIFYSRFSEEKTDLLREILSLIQHGKFGTAAKKMDLRERYPIHLKSAGNYHAAYEELVSYGLLTEYIALNEKYSYCRFVKLTNELVFETLIGIDLIEKHGGIDFNLIKQVDIEYAGYEIKNRLIKFLISGAFSNGVSLDFKEIFQLSNDTLSDTGILDTLLSSTIHAKAQRSELIEYFCTNPIASDYLNRMFMDCRNISEQNKWILIALAENKSSKSLRINALGILLLHSIFTLDSLRSEIYYQSLTLEGLDDTCSGIAITHRLSAILMFKHFFDRDTDQIEMLKLYYYREIAYSGYAKGGNQLDGEFELEVCLVLSYMKSYHKVIQLVDDAEHLYINYEENVITDNLKILMSYRIFAQHALGMKIDDVQLEHLQACESFIQSKQNYDLQIYYYCMMISVYLEMEDRNQVEASFNRAIAISEFANYRLSTNGLLKKMACVYNEWGEMTKERICLDEEQKIFNERVSGRILETLFV
ncbi:hypothetical protein [Ancylomarina longa]|uniref:Uncharacterized protein n=1 Tax=Ancylomarina longa TaxID=2487017 RepID=A0A434AGG6_9BACT|nr:hypothetical protein [Ancylomarina longa]RUT73476.1 hypothetical protein DLK05_13430 [Ancylomarina longa]